MDWFRAAGSGLFLEYGVYSQLGRGPDVQFDERIPLARYTSLGTSFDPGGFDAERLGDLALAAGLAYVGLPARHADGFSLFRTNETDFNSLEASGRDLVAELDRACAARGLGLIVSYSYAADWRHPYFFLPESSQSDWRGSRPAYDSAPPEYLFGKDEDFLHYVRYAHNQLAELAYRYESLAGVRFEPLAGYRSRPDLFPVGQAYSILREARPELLVGFGLGATASEDFAIAELGAGDLPHLEDAVASAAERGKPLEVSLPLAVATDALPDPPRAVAAGLADLLEVARDRGANLLLRTELLADGSLDPRDEAALTGLAASRRGRA